VWIRGRRKERENSDRAQLGHAILFEKLELLKPLSFELFVRVQEHLPIESSQSPFELLVLPLKLLDFVVELFFSHEYLLGPSSLGAFG
jgi:hypothetical protein